MAFIMSLRNLSIRAMAFGSAGFPIAGIPAMPSPAMRPIIMPIIIGHIISILWWCCSIMPGPIIWPPGAGWPWASASAVHPSSARTPSTLRIFFMAVNLLRRSPPRYPRAVAGRSAGVGRAPTPAPRRRRRPLLGLDRDGRPLRCRGLGQGDGQQAVLEGCHHLAAVHGHRQPHAPGEHPVGALDPVIVLFLLLLFLPLLALDRQQVLLQGDLDVLGVHR